MTLTELLSSHLALCDELYQLCLEENRILKQERHAPDEEWRERKRGLADRLEASVTALRERPRTAGEHGGELLERARERSLQILHLDRENEQLLLRCSLATARPVEMPRISPAGAMKAYFRA